jgi:ribosome recycling factor
MPAIKEIESKMKQAIEHLKEELKNIRTGRANPEIFDSVLVEVYGTQMRLKELATITCPEARQMLISPFGQDTLNPIAKSIEQANLNLNPIVDGNSIRINIPAMDQNVRAEMVKQSKKHCENSKISIRGIRRDGNEQAKKDKLLSDDEKKRHEKEVQTLTDKFCKEADELTVNKEKDILTI